MDFSVLISNRGDATQAFVAIKNGAQIRSMNITNFNRIYPGQLYQLPEYIATPANYATLFQLRQPGINSIDDITNIIGNNNVYKVILRTAGTPDEILYIGREGLMQTHVEIVTLRKKQELLQRQYQTLGDFQAVLTRVPTLQELSENAANPGELANLKRDYQLPGGKKTRNKKRKSRKRKFMKR